MHDVEESYLPGIGKKYTFNLHSGEKLVTIVHLDGKRELYLFEKESESPSAVITLNDTEAMKLSALLSGAYFKPKVTEELEFVLRDLKIEWFAVDDNEKLVGKTLKELAIREKTGVSVIAIVREKGSIPNPKAEERIEKGDTLVIIGRVEEIMKFKNTFKG